MFEHLPNILGLPARGTSEANSLFKDEYTIIESHFRKLSVWTEP